MCFRHLERAISPRTPPKIKSVDVTPISQQISIERESEGTSALSTVGLPRASVVIALFRQERLPAIHSPQKHCLQLNGFRVHGNQAVFNSTDCARESWLACLFTRRATMAALTAQKHTQLSHRPRLRQFFSALSWIRHHHRSQHSRKPRALCAFADRAFSFRRKTLGNRSIRGH